MPKARHILDTSKTRIETDLELLMGQVNAALQQARACLADGEHDTCRALIENDARINEKRLAIEHECLMAIARHQPVAHDLREIIACTRIAGELERAGDHAADIAGIVLQMQGEDLSTVAVEDVLAMLDSCTDLMDAVFAAYLGRDADRAREAARMDDAIDAAQAALIEKLFAVMQANPALVPDASRMLWISHNLERCADRGTNIAEQVVFAREAEVVELD